uniref:Uncharacterized protein n=1 Tax=uncultured marine virus TaxID=186617 RepID=A0A0F7L768_9VIRU|nr:hypothetical protein [uncultured marine virus]
MPNVIRNRYAIAFRLPASLRFGLTHFKLFACGLFVLAGRLRQVASEGQEAESFSILIRNGRTVSVLRVLALPAHVIFRHLDRTLAVFDSLLKNVTRTILLDFGVFHEIRNALAL